MSVAGLVSSIKQILSGVGDPEFLLQYGWKPETSSGHQPLLAALAAIDGVEIDPKDDGDWERVLSECVSVVKQIVDLGANLSSIIESSVAVEFAKTFPKQLLDHVVQHYLLTNCQAAEGLALALGLLRATTEVFPDDHSSRCTFFSRRTSLETLPSLFRGELPSLGADNSPAGRELRKASILGLGRMAAGLGCSVHSVNPTDILRDPSASAGAGLRVWILKTGEAELALDVVEEAEGIGFAPLVALQGEQTLEISPGWSLHAEGNLVLLRDLVLRYTPNATERWSVTHVDAAQIIDGTLRLDVESTFIPTKVLLGRKDSTRLELGGISLGSQVRFENGRPSASLVLGCRGLRTIVDLGGADGFLKALSTGASLEGTVDLTVGADTRKGVFLEGAGGFELVLPLHKKLGPIELETLLIEVGLELEGGITAVRGRIGLTFNAKLGPVSVTVERVGAEMRLEANTDGSTSASREFGSFDLRPTFLPPKGAGIRVEAGPVTGGGFLSFDPDKGLYAGALELKLIELGLQAVGFVQTKNPDGSDGFSMVVSIGIEFSPAFQLGMGFTLNAVGGLVGINRTMNLDALRAGFKAGTLDSILFPKDPVTNAPQIISNMQAAFPAAEEHFVIAPQVRVGWGTPSFVLLEVGVFLEIPKWDVVLVGQLEAYFPNRKAALVELHMDILGVLSFTEKRLEVRTRLYNSRVLILDIGGETLFWVSWGDNREFILSLGGFHPRYQLPQGIDALERLRMSMSYGPLSLSLTLYFALTSNTLQFGAKAELYIGIGIAEVNAYIGFDVLITFSPFGFVATIAAGASFKAFGITLLAVRLAFELAGPRPWHAVGEAYAKILFWDVQVHFDETWGERTPALVDPISPDQLRDEVVKALQDSLAPRAPIGLLDPVEIRQRVLPLRIELARVGAAPLTAPMTFAVEAPGGLPASAVRDKFAASHYVEKSEDERLSGPAFESLEAGIELRPGPGSSGADAAKAEAALDYECIRIDDDTGLTRRAAAWPAWRRSPFLTHVFENSRAAARFVAFPAVTLGAEHYAIVSIDTLRRDESIPENTGRLSHLEATQLLARQPHATRVQCRVVPTCEVSS